MNKNAIAIAGNTQPIIGTKMEGKKEAAISSTLLVETTNLRAKFTVNWNQIPDC
jgi:hypothetical protein